MSSIWTELLPVMETIVVTLIVAAALLYSAWRLASARIRLRMLDALGTVLGKEPEGVVGRLRRTTLSKLSSGCGSCSANVKSALHPPGRHH